jgi:hypothetical protein
MPAGDLAFSRQFLRNLVCTDPKPEAVAAGHPLSVCRDLRFTGANRIATTFFTCNSGRTGNITSPPGSTINTASGGTFRSYAVSPELNVTWTNTTLTAALTLSVSCSSIDINPGAVPTVPAPSTFSLAVAGLP